MVAIGSPRPCRSLTIHLQLTSPQLPRLIYSGYSTYRIVCYSLGLDISREAWPDLLQTKHQSPDIVFLETSSRWLHAVSLELQPHPTPTPYRFSNHFQAPS